MKILFVSVHFQPVWGWSGPVRFMLYGNWPGGSPTWAWK